MIRFVGIDPATKTGVVALDENGKVLLETELIGKGERDYERIAMIEDQLWRILQPGDEILIEGIPMMTQKAAFAGGIGYGLRCVVYRKGLTFNEAEPTRVKKFVAVTGWTGETGSKRRLKDKEKKAAVKAAVLEQFGYTNKSDNVTDAYIMARISLNVYRHRELLPMLDTKPYQIEVVQDILNGR